MKIMLIVGTRPEVIKMAPVYIELKKSERFQPILVATGQHREMLDQALSIFDMTPDFDLNIMKDNQSLCDVTSLVLKGVQLLIKDVSPDAVLVHGDTTTCFSSAISAFYAQVPIGHVESGLRTNDLQAPWPEEMNRKLVDPISNWCFAPTERAAENLRSEGISENRIYVTGNTVVDALLHAKKMLIGYQPNLPEALIDCLDYNKIVLVTGHRRESFGKPFERLCVAFKRIVQQNDDTILVYPVHLNPNVRKPVFDILGEEKRIFLIEPTDYLTFIYLMSKASVIITDSGGVQEEAPTFKKPILVTREVTERPEAIDSGVAALVGSNVDLIVSKTHELLSSSEAWEKNSRKKNPYGDGMASQRIVGILGGSLKGR